MLEKITEEELDFIEMLSYPIAIVESLFSDFDNLTEFDEEKFGELRIYQCPFLSFESFIDETLEGSGKEIRKQEFNLRKGVGDVYNFGARKYGKTLVTEKLDIPLSMMNDDGFECGFSSIDAVHIRGVLDTVKRTVENHPILKIWNCKVRTAPNYLFESKNGWVLKGINMNRNAKNPGEQ